MINTGGVTVETAFRLVGLPPPDDSAFYIRAANQAEVRIGPDGSREVTLIESTGDQNPVPDNPLEGSARLTGGPQSTTKRVVRDDAGRITKVIEDTVAL